jgi:hypothetical protein
MKSDTELIARLTDVRRHVDVAAKSLPRRDRHAAAMVEAMLERGEIAEAFEVAERFGLVATQRARYDWARLELAAQHSMLVDIMIASDAVDQMTSGRRKSGWRS